jgi:phage shock protein A
MTAARLVVILVACLLLTLNGAWLGARFERTKRVEIEAAWAAERATLAFDREQATRRALDLERAGNALAARLFESETQNAQRGKEKKREITALAKGRDCLSADLTRLLNETAAARARMSAHPSNTSSAPARSATDTDVGQWIHTAWQQYDACRGRLGAIRQWGEMTQ